MVEFYNYTDKRTKTNASIPNLKIDSSVITDDTEKGEALSRQYSSVFVKDIGDLPNFSKLLPSNSFTIINVLTLIF